MAAFATASRLKLLYALAPGELSVEELAARSGMSANTVSQQLRVLRHLRLVVAQRDGRRMLYRLHDQHLVDLLGAIRHQLEHAERGWSEVPARDDVGV
jgi:DNA-binding transcriptional ArsR family regulator